MRVNPVITLRCILNNKTSVNVTAILFNNQIVKMVMIFKD